MARFWMFTADHSGLPMAIRLSEEGHDVTLALIRPEERTGRWEKPKDQKDVKINEEHLEYLVKNGKGLVPHVWASDAMQKIGRSDYVIFDQIFGWHYREQLFKNGIRVLGGSEVGYKLETERQKTLLMFAQMGFDLPEQKRFGTRSSETAIKFLDSRKDKLFVLKSDSPSVVTQVAENSNEELIQKIKTEKKVINGDGLLLQEKVEGIEYNCETVYCQGNPIFCNLNIEEKLKYNSSSQVQVGCSYDLVWILPLDHPLRERLNKPFDKFASERIGTGIFDISIIHNHKEDKLYPLEVCGSRFGYNQIYTLMELLKIPIGEYFMKLLDGKFSGDVGFKIFEEAYGTSLRIFNDGSVSDSPMIYPQDKREHYWLWDVYQKGGKLYTTGGVLGESPGIITAHADTPEGAYAKIRELYNSFNLATLWARDDYQESKEVNSPLHRFHSMKKFKLI